MTTIGSQISATGQTMDTVGGLGAGTENCYHQAVEIDHIAKKYEHSQRDEGFSMESLMQLLVELEEKTNKLHTSLMRSSINRSASELKLDFKSAEIKKEAARTEAIAGIVSNVCAMTVGLVSLKMTSTSGRSKIPTSQKSSMMKKHGVKNSQEAKENQGFQKEYQQARNAIQAKNSASIGRWQTVGSMASPLAGIGQSIGKLEAAELQEVAEKLKSTKEYREKLDKTLTQFIDNTQKSQDLLLNIMDSLAKAMPATGR